MSERIDDAEAWARFRELLGELVRENADDPEGFSLSLGGLIACLATQGALPGRTAVAVNRLLRQRQDAVCQV